MYVVVAYDIRDDARRNQVAHYLEGFGWRVQYSVFECEIEERHLRRLLQGLEKLLVAGDGLRVYRLASREQVMVLGGPPAVKFHQTTII
jgi:CRISPR-associated protein Cas2